MSLNILTSLSAYVETFDLSDKFMEYARDYKMSDKETKQASHHAKTTVKRGDIILVKTPNPLFSACR